MALTEQEQRCVDLASVRLARRFGGHFQPVSGRTPDELFPQEPSPDVIVSNGTHKVAIEVKRLTGDEELNKYHSNRLSLMRGLAPSAGGRWFLVPALDFRYPMDLRHRRLIKKQLENLAPTMRPGDEGVIRIPREAVVSLTSADGQGWIFCCHTATGEDLMHQASERITGKFMLVDCDTWEHSFETNEGKRAFVEELVRACEERAAGKATRARWEEEWKLYRGKDDVDGAVEVVAVTNARDVRASNYEAVDLVMDSALAKFARRWAATQVIVLEEATILDQEHIVDAVRRYESDFAAIDAVLLVDREGQVIEAWASW